jgi:hypothetical protein
MLWISPKDVSLLSAPLRGVQGITVSRTARRVIEEWSDLGPFATFVDATEVSVEVRIEREIREEEAGASGAIALGAQGELSFVTAPSNASGHGEEVRGTVVVTSVRHVLSGGNGPSQVITCRAVSGDGSSDPLAPAIGGGKP